MTAHTKDDLKALLGLLLLGVMVELAFVFGTYTPKVEPDCSAWTQHEYEIGDVPKSCYDKYKAEQ